MNKKDTKAISLAAEFMQHRDKFWDDDGDVDEDCSVGEFLDATICITIGINEFTASIDSEWVSWEGSGDSPRDAIYSALDSFLNKYCLDRAHVTNPHRIKNLKKLAKITRKFLYQIR